MRATNESVEQRIGRLERELRAWRVVAAVGIAGAIFAACDAPSESLSELDVERHGQRVHVDATGVRIEAGERVATYAADRIVLRDGDHTTTITAAGIEAPSP